MLFHPSKPPVTDLALDVLPIRVRIPKLDISVVATSCCNDPLPFVICEVRLCVTVTPKSNSEEDRDKLRGGPRHRCPHDTCHCDDLEYRRH